MSILKLKRIFSIDHTNKMKLKKLLQVFLETIQASNSTTTTAASVGKRKSLGVSSAAAMHQQQQCKTAHTTTTSTSASTYLLSVIAVSVLLFAFAGCDMQRSFAHALAPQAAESQAGGSSSSSAAANLSLALSASGGGANNGADNPKDAANAKKCTPERHAEMDKCASSLGFLGDRTFIMPRNISSMNGFCGTLTKSLRCIQNYARECLTSFPRQVLLTVTRNGRKQYNQLCSTDQTKLEFMEKLSCLGAENLEQLHQCMDGSIARFEYVANRVETDNRISAICCSYQIFKRDIQETVEKSCSAFPNVSQTAHYLHEIISTTTGELIELVCGAYKSFEDCKAKPKMATLVNTFTDITTKVKRKQIKPKAKSLISLFVSILHSF